MGLKGIRVIPKSISKKKSNNIFQSFGYAFEGLGYALRTVRNLRIHLFFTLLVVFGGMFFGISKMEYFICLLFVALVISIEEAVDLASPDINPIAKRSKDVAAAAVLFSAVMAFIVGLMIFVPRIITFVRGIL